MATFTIRNGRCLARVRVTGFPSISKTFNDRRSAKVWALQVEDEIKRGVYDFGQQDIPTLGAALDTYQKKITPKKRGAKKERSVIAILKRLPLAEKPLDKITSQDIAHVRDMWAQRLSPSTIQKRHALLSHLYNIAIREWNYDLENPLVRVSKPKVDNARSRLICAKELDAILSAAYDDTLKVVAWLAWLTAARLGELAAMQWEHVDLQARTVYFPLTKNGQGRSIPLVPAAVALLEELQPKPKGAVFNATSPQLSKRWASAVTRARRQYVAQCEAQGVVPCAEWLVDCRFHDTRHSAATRFAEMGLTTLQLSAISGHRSLGLLKRYTHISAEGLAVKLAELESSAG